MLWVKTAANKVSLLTQFYNLYNNPTALYRVLLVFSLRFFPSTPIAVLKARIQNERFVTTIPDLCYTMVNFMGRDCATLNMYIFSTKFSYGCHVSLHVPINRTKSIPNSSGVCFLVEEWLWQFITFNNFATKHELWYSQTKTCV